MKEQCPILGELWVAGVYDASDETFVVVTGPLVVETYGAIG
jgi:hypothetical protein